MGYIYIRLENGTVKVFGSQKQFPNEGMFYIRKEEGLSWGDFLFQETLESLKEFKWASKQDEIKTCLKLRNENKPSETLEEYLKNGYHDVSKIVKLKPIITSTKSGSWTDYEVEFNDTENETQEQMIYDIELFIRRENGNNTEMAENIIKEIKQTFILKRK